MNTNLDLKKNRAVKALFVVIILTLIILCVLLIQQYQRIQQLNNIIRHQSPWSILHGAKLLTPADASSTQAWMTFEYINKVFALPPQYIQSTLLITDTRYPRLTIAGYAKSVNMPESTALVDVQNAIRNFSTSTPAK